MALKQYLSYRGLRRMFLGLFISIFLGANIGSFLLYAFFSNILLSEINTSTHKMLSKVVNSTELMYNDVVSLMVQMAFRDTSITKMMFEEERDRIVEYQGHQSMQSALVSYPYIDYLGVYNERLNEIMATKDLSVSSREELKGLTNYYFQRSPYNLSLPIQIRLFSPIPESAKTANTITFIIYSPLSLDKDKGALILGINCDYFQQFIQRMGEGDLETIMILHGNGQIVSHPDTSQQLLNYSEMSFIRRIKDMKSKSGFLIMDFENVETYVSFTQSEVLDWTFISMVPYKKMLARLNSLRYLVLAITFTILCAGIFVSWLMAVNTYKPIQSLLKQLNYTPGGGVVNKKAEDVYIEGQINYLRSTANMSESLIRSMAVLDLLKNQYSDSDAVNSHILNESFKEPYYLVCLMSIDEKHDFEKLNIEEQGKLRQTLAHVALKMIASCCESADYASVLPTDLALVLHLNEGSYPEQLVPLLMETGIVVKKHCDFSMSAVVGSIVSSIFAINDSYEEAEKLLRERFFLGTGRVITKESAVQRKEAAYPQQIGEDLCRTVMSAEDDKIRGIIDRFSAELEQTTYEYTQMHLNTLIMQLLSWCLSHRSPVDPETFHSFIGELKNMRTLADVHKSLVVFCSSLILGFKRKVLDPSPNFIVDSLALVTEKYGDPLFSVNTAATTFNITPAYFNRLFKKHQSVSFSEYLNNYRIEKACHLLRDTNHAIGEIAAMVGIANITYFYTLFKKIYNLTPQQYRRRILP